MTNPKVYSVYNESTLLYTYYFFKGKTSSSDKNDSQSLKKESCDIATNKYWYITVWGQLFAQGVFRQYLQEHQAPVPWIELRKIQCVNTRKEPIYQLQVTKDQTRQATGGREFELRFEQTGVFEIGTATALPFDGKTNARAYKPVVSIM